MTSLLSAAMDVTQLSRTWYKTCDPRLLGLTKKTLVNDQLLSKQLTFKMNTETPSERPAVDQDLQDYQVFIKIIKSLSRGKQMATSFTWPPAFSNFQLLLLLRQLSHLLRERLCSGT